MIFVSIFASLCLTSQHHSNRETGTDSNVLRKLQVLLGQLEEARWIKKNIEKRSRKVSYINIINNDIKENKIEQNG